MRVHDGDGNKNRVSQGVGLGGGGGSPGTPTTGLRERRNNTSRSTGRSGRQNAATRRNMRREERVTVQGPVKKQRPHRMSQRGGGGGIPARTARGGAGHLGLTHTETQQGRLRTACGQRCVDSNNSQTTPATTSTSSIRQLLGAADAQTAHHATFSTAPAHQLLGSANAETTPAGAPAAAADRTQRPDATCEGKNG